ncbi:MAG TPA: SDR family NAD(P)-dependent oxidoreductase [Rectinemataceae bacterium]|nr:SDR family NAD(P)-dependent oxidoreductase [Rectinemataceae bacterium]
MARIQEGVVAAGGVMVTGISSGIGRAIALELVEKGWLVFGTVRKEADRKELLDLDLPNLVPLLYELNDRERLPKLVESVETELARRGETGLFALINNAGGSMVGPIELADTEELSRQFDARVTGSIALVQAFLPAIRRGRGRILWIATPGLMPTPWVAGIHAADFAVNCLARTLAIELGREGPPVVLVRCGGIKTRAGLATRRDLEAGLAKAAPERRALYEARLADWIGSMEEFDTKRSEAGLVGALVARILREPRPKARYRVGHLAAAAALLESLPQVVTDRILAARFAK